MSKVLLVEDDSRLQILGRKVLEGAGHEVEVAGDGATAVSRARSWTPAVVLMDLSLPGLDGLEATRQIKSTNPEIKIVAVTAHAMAGDRERTLEAGCDWFLSKPYEIAALVAAVERFNREEPGA